MNPTVKVIWLGDNRIGGYVLTFTDAQHVNGTATWHSPQTDYRLKAYSRRPIYWAHGLRNIKDEIGTCEGLEQGDAGVVTLNAYLDLARAAGRWCLERVKRGCLYWSAGANPHLSTVKDDGQRLIFPIMELSLVDQPAGLTATRAAYNRQAIIDVWNADYKKSAANALSQVFDRYAVDHALHVLPEPYKL